MVDIDKMPRAIGANYSVWTPDTQITLTNVPWDNNYRDVVNFAGDTQEQQHAALNLYIDSQDTMNVRIVEASYARADQPVRLAVPFTDAYGYNYIRVLNPTQGPNGNGAMYFYYFITGIDYLNPGVTVFNVQIDIWQTFGAQMTLGNCYIERGHISIANSKNFNGYGRDYLTAPEGLDTGSDHRIIYDNTLGMLSPEQTSVMVISNIDLTQDPGDINDPGIKTSKGTKILGAPSGADIYFFTPGMFQSFIEEMSPYPWILQGIMSITAVPAPIALGYKMIGKEAKKNPAIVFAVIDPNERGRGQDFNLLNDWRKSTNITNKIPARYRNLKKFFTYPYMSIELTSFTGAPIVLKPEQWQSQDAKITVKTNFVAPGQRMVLYPRRYNGDPNAPEDTATYNGRVEHFADGGDYLEMSMSIGNFPSFALVNNSGILAIANQAHSLAQQYKTNDWSQQKSMFGNQVAYDQSARSSQNDQANAMVGRNAATSGVGIANSQEVGRAIIGAGSGVIGGAMAGGGVGAIGGAALGAATAGASAAMNISGRNQQLGVSNQANVDTTRNNANTSQYMRDTNKSLADWAARGDYENTIASINAKVQDTAMTPPFTSGQAGGETFNYVFGGINLYTRWKMLPPSELAAIGEYWLRYGYAVRRFAVPPKNLHVMSKFSYWKMTETYIRSSRVPEGIKQAYRGILEKGVTVWVDPRDIGFIDLANNTPKTGISLP